MPVMKSLSLQMHKSPAAVIMMAAAAIFLIISVGFDDALPSQGEQGICLPSPTQWGLPPWADLIGGLLLNAVMLFLMAVINKDFNVLRSNTYLQLGLFAIMEAAVPRQVLNVNSGILLAIVINLCIILLFRCYENAGGVRLVFLAFLMMSIGSTMQYCFVIYIPVLWLVAAQMRIFNLRTIFASIFGLVTPWIILLGFDIVNTSDFHIPQVIGIFRTFEQDSALFLLSITAFTAFLLFITIILNLSRTISYNARDRAFNGALTIIAVVTMLAIAINYNNLLAYLPLLNVCAAYQITHWCVNHTFDRQYIAIIVVCVLYIAFYLWRMIL